MDERARTTDEAQVVAVEPLADAPRLLPAIALVSFSALLLELSLTRLFSVVLFYHFAFLAISVALLGLGAGGVFAFLRKEWLTAKAAAHIASTCCSAAAVSIVAVLWIVLHTNVSIGLSWTNLARLSILYFAAAVPFFFVGVLLSVVFARLPRSIPRMYAADLAGGALACLLTVPLLNWVGGPNAVLVAAFAMAVAAAVWSGGRRNRRVAQFLLVLLLITIILNARGRLFDIVYAKGMYRDPKFVEYAKWNAISRVEVDNQGDKRAIVIDADASTYIMACDPNNFRGTGWERTLMSAAPSIVNVLRPQGTFAIIGPGGGVDVLRALGNGSQHVTGIEINPIIANDIMRGRYADYSYRLYESPQVSIHVRDGRSYVRASKEQFDVVQMTLVDTWASTAAGAFALSENNLYTVEAFREYFDHLKPDGMLAITRWEFKSPREALRVVSNAMEVLRGLGVEDVSHHFIIVSDGELNEDGRPVLVLVKKSPFTRDEEIRAMQHLEQYKNLALIYSPSERSRSAGVHPLDPTLRWNPFTALILTNDPTGFARKYAYNVSPVYDDAPFFFFTLKMGQLFGQSPLQRGIDWKVNLGVLVLLMVFVISLVAVAAFLVGPMMWHAPARGESPARLLYFVAIGLGYILVEIAMIQRFVLFLGHPTYALTVVVFLMLLSSGAGSFVSARLVERPSRVWTLAVVIALVIAAYLFLLPWLLHAAIGVAFWLKLMISATALVPLGLLMGVPFPTGLRALRGASEGRVEWAWALNAASSVLGSVAAILIAIEFNLTTTLACAAVLYVVAAGCTVGFGARQEARPAR